MAYTYDQVDATLKGLFQKIGYKGDPALMTADANLEARNFDSNTLGDMLRAARRPFGIPKGTITDTEFIALKGGTWGGVVNWVLAKANEQAAAA